MVPKNEILITGSTGTVGSEVRRQLLDKKVPFRALVHAESKIPLVAGPGVEVVVGDFDRPETIRRAMAGIKKLFLLTGSDLKQVERERRLVDMAKNADVGHVVKLSVLGAALDAPISFTRWHAQVEKHLEGSGLAYTLLRPNYFMQNFFQSAEGIRNQSVFYGALGEARVSMIDAEDIAAAAVHCLLDSGHENKTYELTGPEAVSQKDAAAIFTKTLGHTVKYVNLSLEESRKAMLGSGMPAWYVDALLDLDRSFLEGFGSKVTLAVKDITGRPARSLADFARHFAKWANRREQKAA